MERVIGLRQAKYLQRIIKERFDLDFKIVEGTKMYMTGRTQQFALLEDPNGFRYTDEEMQSIFSFLQNFEAYRKLLIKGLK
jgi:hypothetical protein